VIFLIVIGKILHVKRTILPKKNVACSSGAGYDIIYCVQSFFDAACAGAVIFDEVNR